MYQAVMHPKLANEKNIGNLSIIVSKTTSIKMIMINIHTFSEVYIKQNKLLLLLDLLPVSSQVAFI